MFAFAKKAWAWLADIKFNLRKAYYVRKGIPLKSFPLAAPMWTHGSIPPKPMSREDHDAYVKTVLAAYHTAATTDDEVTLPFPPNAACNVVPPLGGTSCVAALNPGNQG